MRSHPKKDKSYSQMRLLGGTPHMYIPYLVKHCLRVWVMVTLSKTCTPEPLLRRLLNKEELAHQACVTFHTILVYMGDLPGRQSRVGLELTDLIFTGPLKQASTH